MLSTERKLIDDPSHHVEPLLQVKAEQQALENLRSRSKTHKYIDSCLVKTNSKTELPDIRRSTMAQKQSQT